MADHNKSTNDPEEEKIIDAFKEKDWTEIRTNDSWVLFKLMGEFVNGFEKLSKIGPCVSIFGSARTKPENPYYQLATEIATKLTVQGFGIITGGGPGIMEAGNKGARAGGGKSVGLNIDLPFEQHSNPYIDTDKNIDFDYFFARKVKGFIVLPGGFGTLDELFEALTLIQTLKIGKFPIVLVGTSYWKGLIDWIKTSVVDGEKNVSPQDLNLFKLVDTADEAVQIIVDFYSKYTLKPNF
jgi:uncharacterized protein (TIGR00730 family)